MKVIILAPANDNHTAPLKWALEQAAVRVVCWPGLGWQPERQVSLSLGDTSQVTLGNERVDEDDVIWIRRPEQPKPHPHAAPEDAKFGASEYRHFYHTLMYLLELLPARCVNEFSASRFINSKAVQLHIARSVGLRIPRTLMSNAPRAVREAFPVGHPRMICKAFSPHIWQKEPKDSVAVTETFELDRGLLPDDDVLTFAPAIYQERVAKAYDIRMVLLGNAIYSYALRTPTGVLDWRQEVGQGRIEVKPVDTPEEVERAVLDFAIRGGIACGSLDFAIDQEGRWWFLEVNEGGQFLWLDEFNPEVHMQEKFLSFLTVPVSRNQRPAKAQIEERAGLFRSWKDYLASPESRTVAPEQLDPDVSFVSVEP